MYLLALMPVPPPPVPMQMALVFTAIVTPYEVSLLEEPKTASDPLFIINRFIDAIFFIDMCIQFICM